MLQYNHMKTLRQYITEAQEKGTAIGHFNISNLEAFHAIFNAAKDLDMPVIIGVSEGERKFVGIHEVAALVKSMREAYNFPIFLNADHTYSFEKVKEAIDAGFDAVIFDGVKMSLEENIVETRKCVEYARNCGRDVLVEAELGYIGTSSKMLDEIPEGAQVTEETLTSVEEAVSFVEQTGVDLLAPAVGNLHGMVKDGRNPELVIDRIQGIAEATGIPLVLHGGSGIAEPDFVEGIKNGISVVHINTEIRVAFREGLEWGLNEKPEEIAPYKYLPAAVASVQRVVDDKLRLFGGLREPQD